MHPELQRVIDEAAIRRVIGRYARAIDRCDWDLLRSCYHPDAVDEHQPDASVDEFIAWLRPLTEQLESTCHLLTTPVIDFEEGGDVAWAESYLVALRRTRCQGRSKTDPLAPGEKWTT